MAGTFEATQDRAETGALVETGAQAETGERARIEAERQRVVRRLLSQPFLTDAPADLETFALLRRHAGWLQRWFADQLGYRLVIDAEIARLHKRPPPGGLPRPARTRSGSAFDPRRYTLLCLVLAALERMEQQTILSELAEQVKLLATSEEGITPLDLDRHAERQAFVDAVRLLVDLGVLRLTDGNEGTFVERGVAGGGDALYDISSRRLSQMLAVTIPPSLAQDLQELVEQTYPDTQEGANLRRRHRLMRRLLEEPVLYVAELDDAERAYLTSQRHYLLGQIRLATGLPVEVRREGIAVLDPEGAMTDRSFPATGTVAHAALLLAEHLAAEARREVPGPSLVSRERLRAELDRLAGRYGKLWSQAYTQGEAGGDVLLSEALERLLEMGLAAERPEGIEALPALARFRVGEPAPAAEQASAEAFDG